MTISNPLGKFSREFAGKGKNTTLNTLMIAKDSESNIINP